MFRENMPSGLTKLAIISLLVLIAFSAAVNLYKGVVPSPVYFLLVVIGILLFLVAKLTVITKGKVFSFGTKDMSNGAANMYRFGYWLMIVGVIFTFAGPNI